MDTTRQISKAKLKFLKTLTQKKHREEERLFVVEGWRSVEEACTSRLRLPVFVYTKAASETAQFAGVFASALKRAVESYEVGERELSAITETVTSQGVAVIAEQYALRLDDELASLKKRGAGLIVAMDRISEPGNAGTIIRTADWFGADAVVLSEGSVALSNPKVVRSTMGSLFHLPVIELSQSAHAGRPCVTFVEALGMCRNAGFSLFGADVNAAVDIRHVLWPAKTLIVFGNEAHGLDPKTAEMLDTRITIPKFGGAESLNAAAAAAVILGAVRLR